MIRRTILALALFAAPALQAEPAEKLFGGRTVNQRFGPIDPKLEYNPGRGAADQRTFGTRGAQVPDFHYEQKVSPGSYQTREFSQQKTSWFSKLKFWAKDANTQTGRVIPNVSKPVDVKAAPVGEAREAGKLAQTRALPTGDRVYLGPEAKKLDRAVDPAKPLPGWTGDKMDTLTLEQVRELLNKNK